MPAPELAVVLVNWNGLEDTVECVESLRAQQGVRLHVFIAENGSTPSQADDLRARCPDATVLDTGANLGFAGGNNVAIRAALDAGSEFVMLLNNDTLVPRPDALARLVATARAHPDSVVSPVIAYASEPETVWFVGGRVDERTGAADHEHAGEPVSTFGGIAGTDYLSGCAFLAHRDVWERVGLLEEAYFLYYEDADWSLRARRAGARLLVDRDALVLHKVSRSVHKARAQDFYYLYRNRLLFARRFLGRRYWTSALPRTLANAAWMLAHDAKHRDWHRARLVGKALVDHARGRRGRL